MASADRQERLARALRENLKRRKARDRASVRPEPVRAASEDRDREAAPLSVDPDPIRD